MNARLNNANELKNDEFYTRWDDVKDMVERYAPHLAGKRVYCNADDPHKSNFYKYLVENYNELQLRGLTATAYSGSMPGLFASGGVVARYDGKESIVDSLHGDGGYNSRECLQLLQEHDIVITNPPFSIWREYLRTLIDNNIQFLILGAITAFATAYPFQQYQEGRVWYADDSPKRKSGMPFITPGGATRSIPVAWYTNLGKSTPRKLYDVLTRQYNSNEYQRFDNFPNVINVDRVKDIPTDYYDLIGVPIIYLAQHNPAEFEVIERLGYKTNRYINGRKIFDRVVIRRRTHSVV